MAENRGRIIKIRGHHLHPPLALNLDKIRQFGLVQIIDTYDFFCDEICHRGCSDQITQLGEDIREYDKAIAELYGFEIGRTYPSKDFMRLFKSITGEKALECGRLDARYNGCV